MANTLIKWATIAESIAQRILVYDGDEKFQFKGIEVVPWRIVGRDEQDNVLTGLRQDWLDFWFEGKIKKPKAEPGLHQTTSTSIRININGSIRFAQII